MSNTIRCDRCANMVRRGDAHIRSRRFVQIGWCGPCWKILEHAGQRPWLIRVVRQVFSRAA